MCFNLGLIIVVVFGLNDHRRLPLSRGTARQCEHPKYT